MIGEPAPRDVVHENVSRFCACLRERGVLLQLRRDECEQACALLGVQQLRDLIVADLPRINALPEPQKQDLVNFLRSL